MLRQSLLNMQALLRPSSHASEPLPSSPILEYFRAMYRSTTVERAGYGDYFVWVVEQLAVVEPVAIEDLWDEQIDLLDHVRARPKKCYENAADAASWLDGEIVVGYWVKPEIPLPIPHVWTRLPDGRHFDPTAALALAWENTRMDYYELAVLDRYAYHEFMSAVEWADWIYPWIYWIANDRAADADLLNFNERGL